MAEGNITRIVGGKNIIETDEWIVYTNKFRAIAGGGSYFTADGETTFGFPQKAPSVGHYFKKAYWSSDKAGNKKITKAKIGDIVYFQVEMTDKFPEKTLPAAQQEKISFELYRFTKNQYSNAILYGRMPIFYLTKSPAKKEANKIKYIVWTDTNNNGKVDLEEKATVKPYNEEHVKENRVAIEFPLTHELRIQYPETDGKLKLFLSLAYSWEKIDLPNIESEYLEVELFCCSEACRKPWNDLVEFDPRDVPEIARFIQVKDDNAFLHGKLNRWAIQPISEAYGDKLNMDYYSVKIKKMPSIRPIDFKKPWVLQEKKMWTSDMLFEHIRKNLRYFLDQDVAIFRADSRRDENVWNSENPLTSVMVFHISIAGPFFYDAAVICTSFIPHQEWIFSPVQNPRNNQHPVSGNRQFGLRKIEEGYEFYIRGADRLTGYLDSQAEETAFKSADALWKSFQKKLVTFINSNDGIAEIDETKYEWKRCKWLRKW